MITTHLMWAFCRFSEPWLQLVILVHGETCWSLKLCDFEVPCSQCRSLSVWIIFQKHKERLSETTRAMLFGYSLAEPICKKCLNFIPGIVVIFGGGFRQDSISRFHQRESNRGGRGMTKHPQMNKFTLCSKYCIFVFVKL